MRIVVTGSTGLIGSRLVPALRAEGHQVLRLVRRAALAADEIAWDPAAGVIDTAALQGVDAAVHLAGAGLGDKRWTEARKREIRGSRVQGTTTIATALASLDPLPRVLVSASAIGYYGETGDREVTESDPRGDGFLAEVVEAWENAAEPARRAGIRVVHPRTGLVVSPDGGAWGRLLPLFRRGVGGRIGDGKQYWSFVSMEDEIRGLVRMVVDESLDGPVNLTAPTPLTNAEITEAMGAALHRPTLLTVPSIALKVALGEFSGDILTSTRVIPRRLLDAGFEFDQPTFDEAFARIL